MKLELLRAVFLIAAVLGWAAVLWPVRFTKQNGSKLSMWLSGSILYSTPQLARATGGVVAVLGTAAFILSFFNDR